MTGPITPIGALTPVITTANLSFTLGRNIGAGQGMNSEVFLANDRQLDTQLVIKKVPKSKLTTTAEYFSEARRLYDSRHRHVVEVKYACEDTDHIYLAMPFYRGGSLQSLLEQRHLTTREVVRYGLEFLAGLHHVHVKGLVHFDVKPTNILLDDSDTAALADFGLSKEVMAHGLAPLPRFYRFHMPPECATSLLVSKNADVYQAGVTLYRMCVGHSEFERQLAGLPDATAIVNAITTGRFPDRRRFLPHTPNRLRAVVKKAVEVDPATRFPTVLALMNALAQVDESLDWLHIPGAEFGTGEWSSSDGARSRRVTMTADGGVPPNTTYAVAATRIASSGQARRVSPFCSTGLRATDANTLVRRALTEAWP